MKGEMPDLFRDFDRTARKEHRCGECRRTIMPGEVYRVEEGQWHGNFDSHKTCLECVEIRDSFFCNFIFGNVLDDLRESIWEARGSYSEECLLKLSPAARDKVFEIIERVWRDLEDY